MAGGLVCGSGVSGAPAGFSFFSAGLAAGDAGLVEGVPWAQILVQTDGSPPVPVPTRLPAAPRSGRKPVGCWGGMILGTETVAGAGDAPLPPGLGSLVPGLGCSPGWRGGVSQAGQPLGHDLGRLFLFRESRGFSAFEALAGFKSFF